MTDRPLKIMTSWRIAAALSLLAFAGCSCESKPPAGHPDASISNDGGATTLQVTTTTLPHGTAGVAYSVTLQATGGTGALTWKIGAGSLPEGLALSTAGVLAGTPVSAGQTSFTLNVADAAGMSANGSFTLVVDPGTANMLAIVPTSLPNGIVSVAYSQSLSATGGMTPYSWSMASGMLPPGVTVGQDGTISGTPTAMGLYTFVVKVTDASMPVQTASASLSIMVLENSGSLQVTTMTLPGGTMGQTYTATLAATGGTPPYAWMLSSGTLPTGLSVAANGQIAGVPANIGTFTFTVMVSDSATPKSTAQKQLSITVSPTALTITTASLPRGIVGIVYTATVSAVGGVPPYVFTVQQGTLPDGLSLNATTGAITGSPTTAGTSSITISVSDTGTPQNTAQHSYVITIVPPTPTLQISTVSLPDSVVSVAYSTSLQAAGGTTPYAWSISQGALPPGLVLDTSGAIHGTATATGTFSFTVRVDDQSMPSMNASEPLSIRILAPLSIFQRRLSGGITQMAYFDGIMVSGGALPYHFTITSGSLPPGITLDARSGELGGTPTQTGAFGFTVMVTDGANPTDNASASFSITVTSLLSITTTSLPGGLIGAAYSAMLTATGGTPPYAFEVQPGTTGTLPPGLSIDGPTGAISGTPSAAGTFTFIALVVDISSPVQNATVALSINVLAPPSLMITTSALPGGVTASMYGATLSASGGISPYRWSITAGALPPGLSIDPNSGAISGTPTNAGTFSFTAQVTDSAAPQNSTTRMLSIIVTGPLTITTTGLANGVSGTAYTASLNAAGGTAPYTWSITSGALPPGLALDRNTGSISGTPSSSGSFGFTIGLVDSSNPQQSDSASLTITIIPSLMITTPSLPGGIDGTAYSASIAVSGGVAPYAWSISMGTLPAGLMLDPATGAISGTPTATGVYTFTVTVTDHSTPTPQSTQQQYRVPINGPGTLTITTASLPSVLIGTPYNGQLAASGGTTPYRWSITMGNFPPGLHMDPLTGLISGTPTASGTFGFEITVTDASVPTAQIARRVFSIRVIALLVINTTSLPGGVNGQPYSAAMSASGGTTPYNWQVTGGNLPTGVTLDPATGIFGGTPSATGTFGFTVTVTDSTTPQQSANVNLQIIITDPLMVTTTGFNTAITGRPFSAALSGTGGTTPYRWTISQGALPTGLMLSSSGAITGTPSMAGTYAFTVSVSDSSSPAQSAQAGLTITVADPLRITSTNLPRGTQDLGYSTTLLTSGGIMPFTWTITAGVLPPGLMLDPASGQISGTPTTQGTFFFTVNVTDSSTPNQSNSAMLSIVISAPGSLTIITSSLPDGVYGRAYNANITASGGSAPYDWTVIGGALPAGVGLNPMSGILSGAPVQAGSFTFTVQVADNSSPQQTATRSLSITVATPLSISTSSLPAGVMGAAYSATMTGTGGILPYNWAIQTGMLPPGLMLDPASGTISGTPTAPGTFSFTVRLNDSTSPSQTATRMLSIHVATPLSILTTVVPPAMIGQPYNTTIVASGGTPAYAFSISSGSLPTGLSLNASTGVISGTPSGTLGVYPFTVRVTDSGAPQQAATRMYNMALF
jgi:hypothetical protein